MNNRESSFEFLPFACEYLGIFKNHLDSENTNVLIISEELPSEFKNKRFQNTWSITRSENSDFVLVRDEAVHLTDPFLERILDLFPSNDIYSVVWVHNEEKVFEHRLIIERIQNRFPNLRKFLFVEVHKNSSIEIEIKFGSKVQIIEDTFGNSSYTGRLFGKACVEIDFDNLVRKSKESVLNFELSPAFVPFAFWGDTEIGFGDENLQKINRIYLDSVRFHEIPEQIELLRLLSAKDFEIFDLRNQLRAISTLTEVREDNTEGMKFRLKKESNLNRLLKTPNNGTRKIYKLLPQRLQLSLRILRNKYLRNR
jgi:hypothetical protein